MIDSRSTSVDELREAVSGFGSTYNPDSDSIPRNWLQWSIINKAHPRIDMTAAVAEFEEWLG